MFLRLTLLVRPGLRLKRQGIVTHSPAVGNDVGYGLGVQLGSITPYTTVTQKRDRDRSFHLRRGTGPNKAGAGIPSVATLKRLVSACSSPNNCGTAPTSFQYDGFGNLTSKTLVGVTSGIPVNAGMNQLSNAFYDANGNMMSGAGVTMAYDVANRVRSASPASGGTEYYGYSAENKRVWRLKADGVTEEWTLYGARGERLGVYQWAGVSRPVHIRLETWQFRIFVRLYSTVATTL